MMISMYQHREIELFKSIAKHNAQQPDLFNLEDGAARRRLAELYLLIQIYRLTADSLGIDEQRYAEIIAIAKTIPIDTPEDA